VNGDSSLSSLVGDRRGHGERRRGDEVEGDLVEREKLDQAVDGSSVLEISDCEKGERKEEREEGKSASVSEKKEKSRKEKARKKERERETHSW